MKLNSFYFLTFLLLLTSSLFAQDNKSLISVVYKFVHINDLNNPKQPIEEEMILRISKDLSEYKSYKLETEVKASRKAAMEAFLQNPNRKVYRGMPLAVVYQKGTTSTKLYQNASKNKVFQFTSIAMYDYLIDLENPKIEWKILSESKVIDKYNVQKAIGEFGGRTYTVWFSTDLPFKNGPWKLSGLPGLILEATDEKNEVQLIFKEIYKDEEDRFISINEKKVIKVKEAAFKKLESAYLKNPVLAMQAQLPANSPQVKIAYYDKNGVRSVGAKAEELIEIEKKTNSKIKANPIELK